MEDSRDKLCAYIMMTAVLLCWTLSLFLPQEFLRMSFASTGRVCVGSCAVWADVLWRSFRKRG